MHSSIPLTPAGPAASYIWKQRFRLVLQSADIE